jgi:hypothetical protein
MFTDKMQYTYRNDVLLCGPLYDKLKKSKSVDWCALAYYAGKKHEFDDPSVYIDTDIMITNNSITTYYDISNMSSLLNFNINSTRFTLHIGNPSHPNTKIWAHILSMFKHLHKSIRVYHGSFTPILEIRANKNSTTSIYLAVNRNVHNIDKTIRSQCTSSTVPILDKSFDRIVLCFFEDTYYDFINGKKVFETHEMKRKIKPVSAFCDIKIDFFRIVGEMLCTCASIIVEYRLDN